MDLPALWGGAWQQRAEVQRSWAAYYAGDRHVGRRKPCCLINPRAACEHKRRGRCKLCAWWRRLRVYARWIGYLCVLKLRAAERVYAPNGVGFHLAHASFEINSSMALRSARLISDATIARARCARNGGCAANMPDTCQYPGPGDSSAFGRRRVSKVWWHSACRHMCGTGVTHYPWSQLSPGLKVKMLWRGGC